MTRRLSVEAAWRLSSKVRKADTLSALFARCDYISLHLPVLDTTRGLINAELLGAISPGTCLLNFARQEIVDEDDLLKRWMQASCASISPISRHRR